MRPAIFLLLTLSFSSCALLIPTVSVHITGISPDSALNASDTTAIILSINTNMHADFNFNGSNIVNLRPGQEDFVVNGIQTGWYYMDVVGTDIRIVNIPVYLRGGEKLPLDIGRDYLDINGRTFFDSYQEKSTLYPFYPVFSLNCYGCEFEPVIRFDGAQITIAQSWTTVTPGWHTIEIYSPLDHVQLYYRTLFDSYTITQIDLYPISMFP